MTTDSYRECVEFYNTEAELLDNKQRVKWLDLLSQDLTYRAPLRKTAEDEEQFSDKSFYYNEDFDSLKMRVDRFEHEYAWVETPPARERRFVTNVRIVREDGDRLHVKTNLLLYVGRLDNPGPSQIYSCEREDILQRQTGQLKLAQRIIYLDDTALPSSLPFLL